MIVSSKMRTTATFIVIVISKLLKRYSNAKRTGPPAYSRALNKSTHVHNETCTCEVSRYRFWPDPVRLRCDAMRCAHDMSNRLVMVVQSKSETDRTLSVPVQTWTKEGNSTNRCYHSYHITLKLRLILE